MDDKLVKGERAQAEAGAAYSDAFYRAAPQTSRPCYGYSPAQWNARASGEPASEEPKKRRRGAAMITAACLLFILVAAFLGAGGLYLIMRFDAKEEPVSDRELYNNVRGVPEQNALPSDGGRQREEQTAEAFGLGLTLAEVSPGAARYYDMVVGVYVVGVEEDSLAAEAGLLPGDVIIALDGEEVSGSGTLLRLLGEHTGGEAAELSVWRDGEELSLLLDVSSPAPPSEEP